MQNVIDTAIARFKRYLRRREIADLQDELEQLRTMRRAMTLHEMKLRGKLAMLGVSA